MKRFFGFLVIFSLALLFPTKLFAQTLSQNKIPTQNYYQGQIVKIESSGTKDVYGHKLSYQRVDVKLLQGPKSGNVIKIENSGDMKAFASKTLHKGDKIVVLEVKDYKGTLSYSVWDKYRLEYILYLLIGFFVLVVLASGLRGIGSILGLGVSFLVVMAYIVPQILKGNDPVFISISGAVVIMFVSIYLAHGFSKRTTVAVISTLISLTLTGVFAYFIINVLSLTGLGDENNYLLAIGPASINLKGLLLGGIIIGALGVLDDITTGQSASVFEIAKANPRLKFIDLMESGYRVGREHVASLVNTLILAYAGASLSLFILFVMNPAKTPIWVILNSETIIQEIARSLAGSIGLILSVPITTAIAAYVVTRKKSADN